MALSPFHANRFARSSTSSGAGSAKPVRRRGKKVQRQDRAVSLRAESLEQRAMMAAVNSVSTSFADGIYTTGTVIPITLEFDAPVRVLGSPILYMNSGTGFDPATGVGSTNGIAFYTGSSFDNTRITFSYHIRPGDVTPDLDVFSTNALGDAIVNGTFEDIVGGATFTPVLPGPLSSYRMSFLKNIVVDTVAPAAPTVNPLRINPIIEITDPPFFQQHPDYFTLTGTATVNTAAGEELTVTVNGATYRPVVDPVSGKWAVDLRNDPFTGFRNPWSTTDGATYDAVARVTDRAGNSSIDVRLNDVTIDMDRPAIVGLLTNAIGGSYGIGDTITFDVVFDEPVALGGAGVPFIKLNNNARAVFQGIDGALMTFAYTIKDGDAEQANLDILLPGRITLNGGRIQDLAANQPVSLSGDGTTVGIPDGLELPEFIRVDVTSPRIQAIRILPTSANGWYGPGEIVTLELEMTEQVIVEGSPKIALNSGGFATFVAPPNQTVPTNILLFNYTVSEGESTTSFANPNGLLALASNGAVTNIAGTIRDRAGNDAILTTVDTRLAGVGAAAPGVKITSSPQVTAVTAANLNGDYTVGDVITVIVQFDRPIRVEALPGTTLPFTAANLPALQLNTNRNSSFAIYDYDANDGVDQDSGRLLLRYTIVAGDVTPAGLDLDYLSATSLTSGGFSITHRDAVQVNALLGLATPSAVGSLDYFKNIRVVPDTFGPNPPAIDLVVDTGASSSDNITFDPRVSVSGLENRSVWQYSLNGGATWSPNIQTLNGIDNPLTILPGFFNLPQGVYAPGAVMVRQIDATGNLGLPAVNLSTWVIDQTGPDPVTATIADTGIVDGITNDPTVTVVGDTVLEADGRIEYILNTAPGATWQTVATIFDLPDGTYPLGSLVVRQVDRAGNPGPATPLNPARTIIVDTVVNPIVVQLASDTGPSNSDRYTSVGTLVASLATPLEAGGIIQYWNPDTGLWTPSFNPVEGLNSVTVRQLDRAANESTSTTFDFTLDTIAPNALTVSLLNDTGPNPNDGITSDRRLRLEFVESNATVEYNVNDTGWTTAYAPSAGPISVRVRQTDRAGNKSPESQTFAFTYVDTPPPSPAGIGLVSDTGTSASDRVTSDGRLTNPTNLVLDGVLEYSINGQGWTTVYWPEEGINVIDIRQVDPAGFNSLPTRFSFVLDRTAPAQLGVALAVDSGTSAADRVTNSAGAFVLSNREGGSVVQYSRDGVNYGTAVPAFTDGFNTVYVRQIDVAGNASPVGSLDFTLDRAAPDAPFVGLVEDTGVSATDRITSRADLLVVPNEPNVVLSYSRNGGNTWLNSFIPVQGFNSVLVRAMDEAGNFSTATNFDFTWDTTPHAAPVVRLLNDTGVSALDRITFDPTLDPSGFVAGAVLEYSPTNAPFSWSGTYAPQPGTNTVYVRQLDQAGNTSGASALTFQYVTVPPAAPVVSLVSDTGIPGDRITTNPALNVTSELGAVVQYASNGGSYTSAPQAIQGFNQILVRQMNVAGLFSDPTVFEFTLDVLAPKGFFLNLRNDTGISATDRITFDPSLDFFEEGGTTVEYSVNNGPWSSVYAPNPGVVSVRVRQTDLAGNQTLSPTLAFTYDTTAPSIPGVVLESDTGSSATDRVTRSAGLRVSNLESGASVEYSLDGGGVWQPWTGAVPADQGLNEVFVRQVDRAGNVSAPAVLAFTFDSIRPAVTNVTSPNIDGTYLPGSIITIQVELDEYVVAATGTTATLALNTGGNATFLTPWNTPTNVLTFSYTVRVGDKASDLEYVGTNSLAITAGSIRDTAGNSLLPTLPTPSATTLAAFATFSSGGSLGFNKNLRIANFLQVTIGYGTVDPARAPRTSSNITSIPITFSLAVDNFSLANVRLFLNNRAISLKGATLTGSGRNWTLQIPSIATKSAGMFRLDVNGVIARNGISMGPARQSSYWRRV